MDLFPSTSEVEAVTRGIRVRARGCVTAKRNRSGPWKSVARLVMYNVQFSHVCGVVRASDHAFSGQAMLAHSMCSADACVFERHQRARVRGAITRCPCTACSARCRLLRWF